MKKVMLFEEYNQDFGEDLNEGLKSFFRKIGHYAKRLRLESRILFIKIFLPMIASGVNEKELLKSDVKKLMVYWREFLKANPDAKLGGLKSDVADKSDSDLSTADLKTFAEFYRWLEKKDKDFAENYLGGELKETYDKVINKAKELEKAMDRYGSKNKSDIDYILNN
jgi:hypothetical protein